AAGRGEHVADRERSDVAARRLPPHLLGLIRLLDRRARLLEEALADMGVRHAARLAGEELRAEHRLERLDLRAQRRRRDVETRGRAREMQLLGDRDEVAKMTQLHGTGL